MRAKDPSAPAGKAVYGVVAAVFLSLVLYLSFALPDYKNPLASVDWNALTAKVSRGGSDLFFQSGSTSDASGPLCSASHDLLREFGAHNLRLSQVHVGSGFRVQNALRRAARGEKLRIGLLGGSVSLGHGTDPVTKSRNKYGAVPYDEQWHQYVVRWVNEAFPGVEHDFRNGAKAATDSSFFEWCWESLIGQDLDLVFIEMAVNDDPRKGMTSSENLVRSLLQLESAPGVVFVDFFSLRSVQNHNTSLTGQDVQSSLASWYDVPQISARPVLLQAMVRDPSLAEPFFLGDVRHGTTLVHRFLGNMVVGYLMEELCRAEHAVDEADEGDGRWPVVGTLGQVPRVKLNEAWDADVHHPTKPPTCRTAGAGLEPVEQSADWTFFNWKYSKYYFEALVPDSSEIAFEAEVREGAQGLLAISYLRSVQYHLGKARCWVGEQGAELDGHWAPQTSLAQTQVIAHGLPPGKHIVRCRTLPKSPDHDRTAFRLMGVMTL
ncbi:hypothetical protein Rhopal_004521-T1 [Rhodotorula paludigena]|uniref:Capsular associated protein n=1 Tax=Rhodotorula paludigena TaxID=86838 RepID=A0AAV5GMS1_9BASI|nr:hypothetical protein Rhopal_004521-T1 [Rhodotorula paludigena]